ncbi:hypothetical protein JQV19_08570 [Sulfitobacter mediterraneus]|uniref:hypothetical protein n=1 Tax=Sulfitobacter mediterraneus TaxID=83219 RepID=UPI00193A1C55|nr:hypothetical protein [Sulfitobacter mediterraneus]MBM1556700.1 hypothetical protein [Sulfitobacter mediterraneus]MBM1570103.1 hypothetical protein [Sulfitobacter mediterraneus]MBM1574060.1 hypothetical protein [Sulfitobacter mediterraneus]MBM1577845.1 hypothetical protein [Sulfitobacter mediterraneus]MBM1579658.1 hypothetical protein [Sulfitobacter mediterraneus]
MSYTPELGQAIFGQPHKEHDVPEIMDAALQYIGYELRRVFWNIRQQDTPDPFGNTGGEYNSDVFSVHAYSWGDDDQPWNFKFGEVEISWYKYMGRGMSANMEITPEMASDILVKCLSHLRKLEDDHEPD